MHTDKQPRADEKDVRLQSQASTRERIKMEVREISGTEDGKRVEKAAHSPIKLSGW